MMNLRKSWTIAKKDFSIFRRKKSILISLFAFPLGVSLGLPAVIWLVVHKTLTSYAHLIYLFNAFFFFFIIGTVALAVGMASYSHRWREGREEPGTPSSYTNDRQ